MLFLLYNLIFHVVVSQENTAYGRQYGRKSVVNNIFIYYALHQRMDICTGHFVRVPFNLTCLHCS